MTDPQLYIDRSRRAVARPVKPRRLKTAPFFSLSFKLLSILEFSVVLSNKIELDDFLFETSFP